MARSRKYSVLVKSSDKRYAYHTEEGEVWTGDEKDLSSKVRELLNKYSLDSIVPVHNVEMTANFEFEDVMDEA